MKELSNYINEKLDINKINLHDKFPIGKGSQETIEFLKDNRFEEIDDSIIDDWCDYFDVMNKKSTKVYAFSPATKSDNLDSLKFADTSKAKIGEENPIFHIMHDLKTKKFRYQLCYDYMKWDDVSKKIFSEKLAQHFKWDI